MKDTHNPNDSFGHLAPHSPVDPMYPLGHGGWITSYHEPQFLDREIWYRNVGIDSFWDFWSRFLLTEEFLNGIFKKSVYICNVIFKSVTLRTHGFHHLDTAMGNHSLRNAQTVLHLSGVRRAILAKWWVLAPMSIHGPPSTADYFPCIKEKPDSTDEFRTRDLSIPSPHTSSALSG